jgi:uncharacterized integral membrane protein
VKHLVRGLNALLLAGLAAGFAVANGEERVTVELGLITVRRVSLPLVVFVSVLLGMVLVLAAGLRADLRTRRRLRRYRELLDRKD